MNIIKPRGGNKADLILRYKEDILKMRFQGFSYPQIVSWLKSNGIIVSVSSISRFVREQQK
jgi:intein-encoded DNA endonuclease-like protein